VTADVSKKYCSSPRYGIPQRQDYNGSRKESVEEDAAEQRLVPKASGGDRGRYNMNQQKRETIKVWLDCFAKLTLVVAAIYAVWQYSDTKTKEYQSPIWDVQIKTYAELSRIVSRLTNEFDTLEWEKDKRRFYELYWGEMILVEDSEVEKAMVEFGNRLYDFDQLKETKQMQESMIELRKYAHNVSYALRDSINRGIENHRPSMRLRTDLESKR